MILTINIVTFME